VISKIQVESANKNLKVTAVEVTQCGNFGILGFENGQIQKFNMQSGADRGFFISKTSLIHTREVTGLGIDSLNKFMVSSSLDFSIKQWDFYRKELLRSFQTSTPIENMVYNRTNDLIAYSSSDLTLTIINGRSSLSKVREFKQAANNKITDICFS
jgi:U3 small nucleolar RNA-associated protein 21